MSNFTLNLETRLGSSIHECVREACLLAAKLDVEVSFVFNDVPMTIRPGMEPKDSIRNFFQYFSNGEIITEKVD